MSEGMSQSLLSLTVIFPFQSQRLKEKKKQRNKQKKYPCVSHTKTNFFKANFCT